VSRYLQTDDTGARLEGKNGYCTYIGNDLFAWFKSIQSKSPGQFFGVVAGRAERLCNQRGGPGVYAASVTSQKAGAEGVDRGVPRWHSNAVGERIQLPDIPEEARTPLVKGLVDIIERLVQKVRQQEEEIAQLKDEIAVLKGEKKRARFKPSQLDKKAGREEGALREGKRPGSEKRSKTASLVIHEEKVIAPAEPVPEGSRFKGYRDVVVQDLVIRAHNTRYRLERWETPEGRPLMGELPVSVRGGHFGVTLVSYIVYQHHHCQVTQPLLLEQLREWGIDISAGQVDALLTGKHEPFHEEKDALLPAAYACASYLTVDDTGARHRGQNGYTTHMGNELFAWFESTKSKSRINFLQLLRAGHEDYRVDEEALAYMQAQKLPHGPLERLRTHSEWLFADEAQWDAHLTRLGITPQRHRRIATEGALLGSVLHHGFPKDLPIVSDDAGQFKVLCHGLCWIHAERLTWVSEGWAYAKQILMFPQGVSEVGTERRVPTLRRSRGGSPRRV
jgi:hypothetical protein